MILKSITKKSKNILSFAASIACAGILAVGSLATPIFAANTAATAGTEIDESQYYVKEDNDRVWIRAKIEYTLNGNLSGIDDNAVWLHDSGWEKKEDGYYYYPTPVESGDKIRLIDGFSIPTFWDNDTSDDGFEIKVIAEATEVIPGDNAWNENTPASYRTTFDVYKTGDYGLASDEVISEGSIRLKIVEYQLDKDGNEVAYENDKLVVPGERVSKIVEIQVEGDKGKIWKKVPEVINRATGDNTNIVLWSAGIILATGIIAVTISKRRKAA